MATVPISIRVNPDIKDHLQQQANNDNRSLSQIASIILEKHVKQKKSQTQALTQAIIEAEKELDKGVFISQEEVHKWFNSLGTDNVLPKPKADIFRNNK